MSFQMLGRPSGITCRLSGTSNPVEGSNFNQILSGAKYIKNILNSDLRKQSQTYLGIIKVLRFSMVKHDA